MRLHLLGLPHTVTNAEYSHCAFTGKVLRFPAMMKGMGHHIIHYGVEGAETQADEQVDIMSRELQLQLMGHDGTDKSKFYSDDANTGSQLYKVFNHLLREILMDRVTQNDLVLLPFGHGHQQALANMPYVMMESGIGYNELYNRSQFRVFESNAWMHYHHGKEQRYGKNFEWVIPNYFDVRDWDVQLRVPNDAPVVYLGRICELKGLSAVVEVAKRRPEIKFIICGQGDPAPYLTSSNIEYRPPVTGRERSALLGSARAVMTPTAFTEPFGGVAVEAMMCGTPVLSTTYGAFTETIDDEVTGFRCHTLGDFLAGLDSVHELDRGHIAERARRLYGYKRVSKMYDRAFQQVEDLRTVGWYSTRSAFNKRGAGVSVVHTFL